MDPLGTLLSRRNIFLLVKRRSGVGGLPTGSRRLVPGLGARLPSPLSPESGFCLESCAHKASELLFHNALFFPFFLAGHCHKNKDISKSHNAPSENPSLLPLQKSNLDL